MQHAATFGIVSLACVFAGDMTVAEGLVKACNDGSSINFAKFENVNKVDGASYEVAVENFDAKTGSFNLRIAPAAGLSEEQARFQAQLSTGVICLQFDSPSAEAGSPQLVDEAWLIASGCRGNDLRMEGKC